MKTSDLLALVGENARELATSVVLVSPIAYAVCWKIAPWFGNLEILPQLMLSFSVGLMALLAGSMYLQIIECLFNDVASLPTNEWILLLPFMLSFLTIIIAGLQCSCAAFIGIYFGWCVFGIIVAWFSRIVRR